MLSTLSPTSENKEFHLELGVSLCCSPVIDEAEGKGFFLSLRIVWST